MKRPILLLVICALWLSCSKDEPVYVLDEGYNYFPVEIGRYVIYDVDSIVHNDFTQTVDTFKYQVKEYFESSFSDNSGRSTLRIERYKKSYNDTLPYSLVPWTLSDVWKANRTNTTAEKVEEDVRYVKLSFPVEEEKTWNGNVYNTLGEQDFTYEDIDTRRTIGNIVFDSTLFVEQENSENLIEKKYYVEIYGKNVGLIYKEIVDVRSDNIIAGVPLMSRINSGVEYKMTFNSSGSN
jgi:hypothetical protein